MLHRLHGLCSRLLVHHVQVEEILWRCKVELRVGEVGSTFACAVAALHWLRAHRIVIRRIITVGRCRRQGGERAHHCAESKLTRACRPPVKTLTSTRPWFHFGTAAFGSGILD
jgi:hypothetical protein